MERLYSKDCKWSFHIAAFHEATELSLRTICHPSLILALSYLCISAASLHASADGAQVDVWLSASPESPGAPDVPLINASGETQLFIWAALDAEATITDLALDILASNGGLESAEFENPILSTGESRFEFVSTTILSSELIELNGFTLGERERRGGGFGSVTATADPLFDASRRVWRIGSIRASGVTDLSLQIGRNGIQGLDSTGQSTPSFSVVFGDETDTPLCAIEDRRVSSSSTDAILRAGDLVASNVGDWSGAFFQDAQQTLELNSILPWRIGGSASIAGGLSVIAGNSPVRGEQDVARLLEAQSFHGSFDRLLVNGMPIVADNHLSDGLFYSLRYEDEAISLVSYSALIGDANGDGSVNFGDFLLLSAGFGNSGAWTNGDFDSDGFVRFSDFLLLSGSFGAEVVGQSQSVPEPNSSHYLVLILLVVMRGYLGLRRSPTACST